MSKYFRFRNVILIGGTLLILLFMFLSDPNGGALTTVLAAQLATPVIAVWFAHLARKALFDYIDMKELYVKAKESAVGAAIAFASMCLIIFALLGLFGGQVKAQDVTTYIPEQAKIHLVTVRDEQKTHWVTHPKPIY